MQISTEESKSTVSFSYPPPQSVAGGMSSEVHHQDNFHDVDRTEFDRYLRTPIYNPEIFPKVPQTMPVVHHDYFTQGYFHNFLTSSHDNYEPNPIQDYYTGEYHEQPGYQQPVGFTSLRNNYENGLDVQGPSYHSRSFNCEKGNPIVADRSFTNMEYDKTVNSESSNSIISVFTELRNEFANDS